MIKVVVVGGGIAGASVAIALAERGSRVSLIDLESPGAAATGAAAGLLAPQYESLRTGALFEALVASRSYFARFAEALRDLTGEALRVRWDGMLVANLDRAEHRLAAARAAWQREAGAEAELLEPDEAAGMQPGLAPDAVSFLWLPGEGQVDCQHLGGLLPRALAAAGVEVLGSRRVRDVQVEAGAVRGVELTDDRFLAADAVVIAAGAWSAGVGLPSMRIPVRPVRGHLLRFAPGSIPLRHLVGLNSGHFVVPRGDDSVLVGSSMEEAGFDRSTDPDTVRAIHDAATRLVPALGGRTPASAWADLRPVCMDGLPVVGADPVTEGVFHATGYGRTGILMSPLAGRVLADLVFGGSLADPWRQFSPSRLAPLGSGSGG